MHRHSECSWQAALLSMILALVVTPLAIAADSKAKVLPGDYVLANGSKLWYASEGQGQPLIIIAGGPGGSHQYLYPYFSPLADMYRVIYFDSFGRGKSDRAKSPAEYTFERDVEDVEALRKALRLNKINLLGHSYGTMIAQAYAIKYPQSVNKLVLANSFISGAAWQAGQDLINEEIKNLFPEQWEKLAKLRAQGLISTSKEHQEVLWTVPVVAICCVADPAKANAWTPEALSLEPDVYYSIAGGDADFVTGGDLGKLDFRSAVKNIKAPTLILAGRYDRIALPRYVFLYRQYMPQAELVMFEETGHFGFMEDSEKTIAELRKFLGKK